MSLIPASHSWNLTNYARRKDSNSSTNNEYFWLCLNENQTLLKMIITPTLQLSIISSEQCIEELIDIWLMFNCTHIHVHRKSMLFYYTWPPKLSSSTNNLTRSFRIKFSNDKDLSQCLKLLEDYFPISVYSPSDINVCIKSTQPTELNSIFFNETKHVLASEQSTTINIRTNFIRQYLSTCIMDPVFYIFVNKNEEYLKKILREN